MRLEEAFIKTGFFWLPENHDTKIPGTLTISNGGNIELELVGHFDDNLSSSDVHDFKRIIGYIENNELVTLDNCFYTFKSGFRGDVSKSKICVNRAFVGVAYEKDESVTFNSLSFSVDCLDEWVGITGIKVVKDRDNRTATISYEHPKNIVFRLDKGMQLEICFAYTLPGSPTTTEATITQTAYFKLTSEELRPLDEFTDVAYKITSLICFATDTTVTIKNLIATSAELQKELYEGRFYPAFIRIYYQSIPFSEKVPNKSWHQMLFSYGQIKSNAQDVFNKWINAYDVIAPALSLYFSTQIGAQKYLEGKFLALAQGLETYHRRTSDEILMEPSEFESLVAILAKNCPEEHLPWLNGRLMNGNEINLGKRLKRIVEPFKNSLGNSTKRSSLLKKIVDTRNYLTHYNEDLKSKAAHGKDLWVLCQKMEVIFQLHFLKVIGFSEVEIASVIENCFPLNRKISEI